MVLEFKNIRELKGLIRIPYYMTLPSGVRRHRIHATIKDLTEWSKEVEMQMYYCGGSIYFDNKKDETMFILKWM